MPRIDDRYHRFIIAPKLKAFSLEKGVPYSTGNDYGFQLLPLEANAPSLNAGGVVSGPETTDPGKNRQNL